MGIKIVGEWTKEDEEKRQDESMKEVEEFIFQNPVENRDTPTSHAESDNLAPIQVTKELLDSMDKFDRIIALDNYRKWVKKQRKEDRRQVMNQYNRIKRFKGEIFKVHMGQKSIRIDDEFRLELRYYVDKEGFKVQENIEHKFLEQKYSDNCLFCNKVIIGYRSRRYCSHKCQRKNNAKRTLERYYKNKQKVKK